MWRLKVAKGAGPWLKSCNNFRGRTVWEFDPELGMPEERAEVERVRREFTERRFQKRESSDLLLCMQSRFSDAYIHETSLSPSLYRRAPVQSSCSARAGKPEKLNSSYGLTVEEAVVRAHAALHWGAAGGIDAVPMQER